MGRKARLSFQDNVLTAPGLESGRLLADVESGEVFHQPGMDIFTLSAE
jgi:hypothetical protein